ncbi:MAG: site-specific integrase [Planctomycetota bacterium]
MASITNEPNGRRTIQVVGTDGKRRSIRLGKVSKRHAEAVRSRIEELISCQKTGQSRPAELSEWIESTDDAFHARLVNASLVSERHRVTLAGFIDDYIDSRTDTKVSTRTVYRRARRHLVMFFGDDKLMREITPAEADRFRIFLGEQGLAAATARRAIGICKQLFRAAVRAGLIPTNPFADLSSATVVNPARAFFVDRATIDKVLAAATDDEWRLLIGLSRFGGLRVPSEPLMLTWGDIDLAKERIRVKSPKTEHHRGKAERMTPLFPELRSLFDAVRPNEPDPEAPVITRYRMTTVNLRTRLMKTIKRAGFEPWPKLWHNMRASRETELVERFPSHVVAAWLGHTVIIAEKHYLQVTEEHFAKAAELPEVKAVRNPVQSLRESGRIEENVTTSTGCNLPLFRALRRHTR